MTDAEGKSGGVSSRRKRRVRRRLSNPMTLGDFILLAIGTAVIPTIFNYAAGFFGSFVPVDDFVTMLVYNFVGIFIPALIGVFVGMAIASWQYKIVAGVIGIIVLMGLSVSDMIWAGHFGFVSFLYAVIRFSFTMTGVIVAFLPWNHWRRNRIAPEKSFVVTPEPDRRNDGPPRSALLVRLISLVSIPFLYVAVFLSTLVTVGIGALLVLLINQSESVSVVFVFIAYGVPFFAVIGTLRALRHIVAPRRIVLPAVLVRSDAFSTLRGIIDEVCDKTGSRRPRNIILHAEPTFFVAQGRIDTYDGPLRGRTVALGMPLLRILSPVEIRSALTAEFSRFVGIDGIFEVIFTPVCAGFGAAVRSLADKPGDTREGALLRPLTEQSKRSKFGDATITIFQWPAVSFFKSVHLFLTSLEAAMNRRRVLRSDWIAAAQYGREAFTRSLRKVTGIGLHYQDALERVDRDGARTFFAAYADLAGVEKTQIAEAVEEEMGRGESEFSSQPSLAVRLASAPDGVAPVETYTTGLIQELAADEKRLAHRFGAKVEEIYGDGGEEVEFGFDNSVEDDDDYSES